jgi:hypothetical protein
MPCSANSTRRSAWKPEDVEVLGSTRGWLRYRLPRQYVRDRCIGQKQRWFLLRLTADESKLRFDATGQPEFDRWRWADYWTPVREVVYFKRRVYVRALHELGKICFPTACRPIRTGGRSWSSRRVGGPRRLQNGFTTASIDDADQQQRRRSLNMRYHLELCVLLPLRELPHER